jgi:hypothetical protein
VRRLVIPPEISRAIGACGLTRAGVVRVLSTVRFELERRGDEHRGARHPEDNTLFLFPLRLDEGAVSHRLVFVVDDTTAAGVLFVTDLVHWTAPL